MELEVKIILQGGMELQMEENIGLHGYGERRARHERVNRYARNLSIYYIDFLTELGYYIREQMYSFGRG